MFCTTIIPTVNRSTLSRAVYSVLNQTFNREEFEIIVVNDTGRPLSKAGWQESEHVQVITTHKRERCVARNTGAALAKGRYLHFLDDDDWLLPGALEELWILSQNAKDAAWLYGSSQLVDRQGNNIIQLHHQLNGNCFIQVIAGEWIPLQASLLEARIFFAVGGFNPLIAGTEDIDLCRHVALYGSMAKTPKIVACIAMGTENSTTDYDRARILGQSAREDILNNSNTFRRLRTSANSGFWQGRIVRAYLTSTIWNLQHRHISKAVSRAMFGITSLCLAGRHLVSQEFWNAVKEPYKSETFARGFQDAQIN